MGKTGFVDQKAAARFGRVRALVMADRLRFAVQGSVVAGWRVYGGRRLGPYFRLAYRDGGRQRSIYLGRCLELARRVRELLAGLQRPRRDRLLFARLIAQVRASLRSAKAELERRLAVWGIRLEGFKFRGVRQAFGPGRYPGKPLHPRPGSRQGTRAGSLKQPASPHARTWDQPKNNFPIWRVDSPSPRPSPARGEGDYSSADPY